jgi:hypothetical protein
MSRARPFAELSFLAILAIGASPKGDPGSGMTSLDQVARLWIPDGAEPGLLNRATLAERTPLDSKPVDETRREAASKDLKEFSGGPTGTLLIGAALLAAVALILAVVIRW